jgi:hypothetical protein
MKMTGETSFIGSLYFLMNKLERCPFQFKNSKFRLATEGTD